jgi:regulator of cell morphogenesis and NO signaling
MTTIKLDTTVGQLVAERPARSRVFEKLGIDYCCGGKMPLAQACADQGLDPGTVVQVLAAAEVTDNTTAPADAAAMSLTELADHIQATHHAYLRQELPRLSAMSRKVASVHGEHYAWTIQVAQIVDDFVAELNAHMMKEEQILFPLIRQLDSAAGPTQFHCGSVANPIRVMEMEHDSAGNALARMRALSGGYTPPADACNTFRALLAGLAELEADLHQHIHKENNILFPRAAAAEHGKAGD